jgi:hypothetical protein
VLDGGGAAGGERGERRGKLLEVRERGREGERRAAGGERERRERKRLKARQSVCV